MSIGLAGVAHASTYSYQYAPDKDLSDLNHADAYILGISDTTLQTELKTGYQITGFSITFKNIYDWKAGEDDHLYMDLLDNTLKTGTADKANGEIKNGKWTGSTTLTTISNENPNPTVANGDYFDIPHKTAHVVNGKTTYTMDKTLNTSTVGYTNSVDLTTWSDPKGGSARNFNLTESWTLGHASDGMVLNLLQNYITDANDSSHNMFGLGFDPECHYFNDGVCITIITAPCRTVPELASTLMLLGLGLGSVAGLKRFKARRA